MIGADTGGSFCLNARAVSRLRPTGPGWLGFPTVPTSILRALKVPWSTLTDNPRSARTVRLKGRFGARLAISSRAERLAVAVVAGADPTTRRLAAGGPFGFRLCFQFRWNEVMLVDQRFAPGPRSCAGLFVDLVYSFSVLSTSRVFFSLT